MGGCHTNFTNTCQASDTETEGRIKARNYFYLTYQFIAQQLYTILYQEKSKDKKQTKQNKKQNTICHYIKPPKNV